MADIENNDDVLLDTQRSAHRAWHEQVEEGRTAPHGPLSVTGLHWLDETPREYAGVPGRWSADADGLVTVELSAENGVTRDGAVVSGSVVLGRLTGTQGLVLTWGDRQIDVAARSGRIALRPRDPRSPDRVGYTGTQTFPFDPRWVVRAEFIPVHRADVEVASAAGENAKQHYDSPGSAKFTVDGYEASLTLFGESDGSPLRLIYADATGADLTFPAARFVSVARIDERTVEIDFNRTTNPPCAYTASATCPFPPPENRIPVRIEAGELRPGVKSPRRPDAAYVGGAPGGGGA